jgi:hypothetical protein
MWRHFRVPPAKKEENPWEESLEEENGRNTEV